MLQVKKLRLREFSNSFKVTELDGIQTQGV